MSKNKLIIMVSAIVAAVILVVTIALCNVFKSKKKQPDGSSDLPVTSLDSTQKPEETKPDETKPEETKPEDTKPEETKPEETKPEESKPAETKPEETKPEEPKPDPAPAVTQPANNIVYNTQQPESYKDFSLTSGMSAKEAYDYLSSFLNSKYSILINRANKVNPDYEPSDLVTAVGGEYEMERTAAAALENMLSDARSAGYSDIVLYSGYRTYSSQKRKYENRTQRYLDQGYSQTDAEAKAGEYIAPPGASEHHTGLAADICSSRHVAKYGYLDDSFDQTAEWQWLHDNSARYGFIMRYMKGRESTTGYNYEPWHYRYLGVDHAGACTALNMTYEEYHAMISKFCEQAKAEAGV